MKLEKLIKCNFNCDCFALTVAGRCTLLSEKIEKDRCPFAKPNRYYTNGVYYPYNEKLFRGENYEE